MLNFFHVSYTAQLTQKQHDNKEKLATYFEDVTSDFRTVFNENVVDAIMKFQQKNNSL